MQPTARTSLCALRLMPSVIRPEGITLRIEFSIPPPHEPLKSVCSVPIARRGESWSEACLGPKGKDQGVYVIRHGDKIIYVGKTDGPSMSFGIRLRREFQESAS